jgi:hypothetical protein
MITTREISDDHHFFNREMSGFGVCVVVVVVPSGLGDADGGEGGGGVCAEAVGLTVGV